MVCFLFFDLAYGFFCMIFDVWFDVIYFKSVVIYEYIEIFIYYSLNSIYVFDIKVELMDV